MCVCALHLHNLLEMINVCFSCPWLVFKVLQTVLFCKDKPTSVLCVLTINVFVYTTSPTGFWVWCHILQGTGKTWQTSQQRSLLGLIQPVFPPRNPGRLTGNKPNSPKATVSQPLPSPEASPPYPENLSWGLFYASLRQTILQIDILLHHTPISPSMPSAQLPIAVLSCLSL